MGKIKKSTSKKDQRQETLGVGPVGSALSGRDIVFLANTFFTVLSEPKFSIKKLLEVYPSITYRKLNHWESTGLIQPHRETEGTGWRYFSFLDLVRLVLIDHLKQLGVRTEVIRSALAVVEQRIHGVSNDPDHKMSALEYAILGSLFAFPSAILVFKSGNCLVGSYEGVIGPYLIHIPVVEPFILHPFNEIVNIALKAVGRTPYHETKITSIVSPKVVKLFQYIDDGKCEKIELTLKDGKIKKLSATRRKSGKLTNSEIIEAIRSGPFRNIRVSVGDKDLILTEEEVVNL